MKKGSLLKQSQTLFITGGLGYLGSALAQRAIREGYTVVLYDILRYYQDAPHIIREMLKGLKNKKRMFTVVRGDTRNNVFLRKTLKRRCPSWVIHFGDLVGVYACENNPALTHDINWRGTKNVVDACTDYGIPLLYNSSSSVYGARGKGCRMKETDILPPSTDLYCAHKILAERYIQKKRKSGLRAIVFRPATVCGPAPRMRLDLLPNHFTYVAICKRAIRLAQLHAGRAVMDINDLIDAYMKVIIRSAWRHPVYNVGHYSWSKEKYALAIQRRTKCDIVVDEHVGDARNLGIDTSRFEKEFRWKPKVSFTESIEAIVEWVKKNAESIERNNYRGVVNMPLRVWHRLL